MRIVILTGVFYFVFPCIAYIAGDTSRVVLTQDDFLHKHAAVYATYDDFINRRPLKGSWERRHHPNIYTHEQHRYEECILTSPIARDESQYRVVMELRKFNNSIYDFWPRSFRLRPWSDAVQRLQDRTILFLGDSLQKFQASSFACQLAASSPTESLPLIWAHHIFNEGAEMETKRQPSFCARLETLGSVVCWWSSGKARGRQLGVAYRVSCVTMNLSPRDLVVASTGVHYKHPNYFRDDILNGRMIYDKQNFKMLELEAFSLRKSSEELRWVCPHVVWRETAPQFWPNGFYPANVVNTIDKPDRRVEMCAPWRTTLRDTYNMSHDVSGILLEKKRKNDIIDRQNSLNRAVDDLNSREAKQYNYYNTVLLGALWKEMHGYEIDIPVLSTFWATASQTMPNLQLELTSQAWHQPYDCTHFTVVGNVYSFWNQLVLTEFIAFEDTYFERKSEKKTLSAKSTGSVMDTMTDQARDAVEALGLSPPSLKTLKIRYDEVLKSRGQKMNKDDFAEEFRHADVRKLRLFIDELFSMLDLDGNGNLEFGEILVAVASFGTYSDEQVQRLCVDTVQRVAGTARVSKEQREPEFQCQSSQSSLQAILQSFLYPQSLKYFPIDAWPRCRSLDCRWERAKLLLSINQTKANLNNNEKPKPFLIPSAFMDVASAGSHARWKILQLLDPKSWR